MNAEARPVLMSRIIAERLGILDRWVVVDPLGLERGTGIVSVTEAELLTDGVERLDWNEADAAGYYTPTLYSKPWEPTT